MLVQTDGDYHPAVGDGRDFRCGQERMGPSVRQVRRGLGFHRDQCGAAVYP